MHYTIRKYKDRAFTLICYIALFAVIATISSLLWTLISRGMDGLLHWSFYSKLTPAPGVVGGMKNAIVGTLIMTGLAVVMATPIGILIATYLSEFSAGKRIAVIIRFVNDVLLSAPSIIIGLFCYAVLVKPFHHFSAFAGCIALTIIALPIIVRTCEDMLEIAPQTLREAALALGAPYWKMLFKIIMKSVYQGIFTGVLLAIARILGETAPLLFTSLNNQFFSVSINKPIASLPVVIYQYAMSPYADWQSLAWAAALLITISVCLLSIVSKILMKK